MRLNQPLPANFGYVYQEFPKWKYHIDFSFEDFKGSVVPGKAEIVPDHDAELGLGADWYDTPAEAGEAAQQRTKPTPEEAPPVVQSQSETIADYKQPGFKRETK